MDGAEPTVSLLELSLSFLICPFRGRDSKGRCGKTHGVLGFVWISKRNEAVTVSKVITPTKRVVITGMHLNGRPCYLMHHRGKGPTVVCDLPTHEADAFATLGEVKGSMQCSLDGAVFEIEFGAEDPAVSGGPEDAIEEPPDTDPVH